MTDNDKPSLKIEPDALRAAEFMQAQAMLDGLAGQTIVTATVEETRIALVTSSGAVFYFYGFMGKDEGKA